MSLINDVQRAALQAACDDAQRAVLDATDGLTKAQAVVAGWQAQLDDAQARCDALTAGLLATPADVTVVPITDPLPLL